MKANDTAGVATPRPLIYERMAEVNRKVTAISKGRRNEAQKFMFRGIDDMYNELHPLLAEAEIFIVPEVVATEFIPQQKGYFARATMAYHFTTVDGSSLTARVIGEAMDYGDKAMNKAMSIALKYALLQVFTIPTDEAKDPDAHSPVVIPPEHQGAGGADKETAVFAIKTADSVASLTAIYKSLSKTLQSDREIIAVCQQVKSDLLKRQDEAQRGTSLT